MEHHHPPKAYATLLVKMESWHSSRTSSSYFNPNFVTVSVDSFLSVRQRVLTQTPDRQSRSLDLIS